MSLTTDNNYNHIHNDYHEYADYLIIMVCYNNEITVMIMMMEIMMAFMTITIIMMMMMIMVMTVMLMTMIMMIIMGMIMTIGIFNITTIKLKL